MKKPVFFSIFFALMLLCACRQVVQLERPDNNGYYTTSLRLADIFDRFWQAMNNNYVYWDLEPENYWNNIYEKYMPKFEALGLLVPDGTEVIDDNGRPTVIGNAQSAYTLFKEIISPLHDGHLVMEFDPGWFMPTPSVSPIMPSADRILHRPVRDDARLFLSDWSNPISNPNFWASLISNYIQNGSGLDTFSIDRRCPLRAATGRITHSDGGFILYLYFSHFFLYDTLQKEAESGGAQPLTRVLTQFFEDLKREDLRGVIFDLRGNSGGSNIDISYLLGPMLKEDLLIAHTRTKAGPSPLDYRPWAPYLIPPAPPDLRMTNFGVPAAALCNDFSVSCAELTALAVKAMPGGWIVGSQTWGAIGPRLSDTSPLLTNGGSFSGGPFWTRVTQAGYQTRGVDFANYDGIGIKPNEEVAFRTGNFTKDAQLEAAILHIDSQAQF